MLTYDPRTVVVEGTRSGMDGQWWAVQDLNQFVVAIQHSIQDCEIAKEGDKISASSYDTLLMRPAGRLRWDSERCAEVYVPEGRWDAWAREHNVPQCGHDGEHVVLYTKRLGYWTFVPRHMRRGLIEDGFVATDRFVQMFDLPPSEVMVFRNDIPDWILTSSQWIGVSE